MQRPCAYCSNPRHSTLAIRPAYASLSRTALGFSAVLLFALVALPVTCRSTPDPASAPIANTVQLNQTNSASDNNGEEAMKRRLREARDRGEGTPAPPVAGATNAPAADELASIDFNDVPLTEAIRTIAVQMGMNVQFDPSLFNQQVPNRILISPPTVNVKWTNVTVPQGLQALLVNHGLVLERMTNNPITRIRAATLNDIVPKLTKVNLLEKAPGQSAGEDEQAEIEFNGYFLTDAIQTLAFAARLNIQFDPALTRPQGPNLQPIPPVMVTEKWKKITVRQALQALLDGNGLQMTQIPGNPILRVQAK